MLEIGLRVVRGHDWKWKDQDGGEGHAGTVVEIGKPLNPLLNSATNQQNSSDKTPDKTVIVQWDHGSRSNYRIGYQGFHDLLVFDNAAAGVQHNHIVCDGCKKHGIVGFRWKCIQCDDYDLCTHCYMGDIHDLTHTFQRFQTADALGIELSSREGCTKIPLRGIFIGAKVVRGPDWEWGNQDGGPGKSGRVMDIRGWDNESSRSVATVTWTSGSTNVYRLGYKGCVDLCYIEEASCGYYYKEHLPVLGQTVLTINDRRVDTIESDTSVTNSYNTTLNIGDKVRVLRDIETLKEMQTGHGGWNPRMVEYIGKIGMVHRITDKGDVRVQYEGCNNRWTFHPKALSKVTSEQTFELGDLVQVKNDAAAVKNYQQGHGEWIDIMKTALGKTGKVIKIYSDGDLRVNLNGYTWTFNPLSVMKVSNATGEVQCNSANQPCAPIDGSFIEVEKLLRDAARCEAGFSSVREFLKKYAGNVDVRPNGVSGGKKTCLQVAAHQGNRELCTLLLDAGASLLAADEDGDLPLHYAAFGDQAGVMEFLISRGAPIDTVNNSGCSALHVAVNKQNATCVRILLNHECNVNLQDSYGDTALHDAIGKDATGIIDALIACDRIDFTLRNKRGFNVLHHAALKGNSYATRQLMTRIHHLVDVKKDDGFAALHLAALNGHREVTDILLMQSSARASVDLRNNRQQTPLHLAVSQGHWQLVELLLKYNADITAVDEDGDTVLHIAITKSNHQAATAPLANTSHDLSAIHTIWQNLTASNMPNELALACFLINVSDFGKILIQAKNSKGKTPLDLLSPERTGHYVSNLLLSYVRNLHPQVHQLQEVNSSYASNTIDSGSNNIEKSTGSQNSNSTVNVTLSKTDEIDKDLERLRYLETRVADLEEANMCSICLERRRNIAFLCGHGACEHCAAPLKTCHMCRKDITKKINLY